MQALVVELVGVQTEDQEEEHAELDKTATPRDMDLGTVTATLQPLAVALLPDAARYIHRD